MRGCGRLGGGRILWKIVEKKLEYKFGGQFNTLGGSKWSIDLKLGALEVDSPQRFFDRK